MRVLITGAGRAIGRATAEALTERGHEVVATARRPEVLDDLDVAQTLALDVTDDDSVAACVAAAGDLDAIVNNAALNVRGPLDEYPTETFNQVLDTNVTGVLRMVQAVLPVWRPRGSGVFVNISSVNGKVASPLSGSYAASKYALEAMSEAMHYELGHFGIRTVIVEPGFIAPGMKADTEHLGPADYDRLREQWDGMDDELVGDGGRTPTDVAAGIIADCVENADTPLRVPIGPDAETTLAFRKQLSDEEFEAAMRAQLGLTW